MEQTQVIVGILDYAMGRKGLIEAKADLLRRFAAPQTERQAQLLADYVEEILTQVKFSDLTVDLAVVGMVEMASASFV